MCLSGGSGFGSPFERPLAAIARDLAEGYVTPEAAARDYGVVIGADGKLDMAQSARAARAGHGGGVTQLNAKRTRISPIAWAIAPAALLFVLFFILPFGVMAMLSFLSGNPVSNPNVSFTWRHYNRLVDSDLYFDALVATMRIGAVTTIIALLIGYPLAHWMARMHSRVGHALLLMAVIAPLLTGIVVRTFAWMTLLGDRGVINITAQWLGLAEKPLPLMYNEFGVVIGLVHIYVPFMVLTLVGVIGRIDRTLEEAARGLGASRFAHLPGGDAAAEPAGHPGRLLACLRAGDQRLRDAGAARWKQRAHPADADLSTGERELQPRVCRRARGCAAGGLLGAGLRLQYHPRPADRRKTDRMSRRFDAGHAAYLTLNGAIVAFLLLPIAVVIVFALNPTPYIAFPPVGVSLRWFVKFFTSAEFMNALWLSLRVAVIVVVLSTVIGAMCALAIARGNLPGARLLTTLFLSPLMLPAILTGLALFQVFMLAGIGRPVWGLVAGHTLVAVPYVLRTTLAVLQNFDRRVEEAAAMLGAPPARVFFEVTLPLIRPGVIAGGIFAFIVSFDQLPISLFLVVPGGETLPVVLLNYIRFDLDGAIAAASMVSIVLALSAVLLLERIIGLRAYVRL